MRPLAPLLSEFLLKNWTLLGDYFHFGTFEKYKRKIGKCERQHLSTLCSCYDVTIKSSSSSLMNNIIHKRKKLETGRKLPGAAPRREQSPSLLIKVNFVNRLKSMRKFWGMGRGWRHQPYSISAWVKSFYADRFSKFDFLYSLACPNTQKSDFTILSIELSLQTLPTLSEVIHFAS